MKQEMEIRTTEWHPQNMRICNTEDYSEYGVCYDKTQQTWISLHRHLTEDDIKYTGVEESLHQGIRNTTTGSMDESDNFDLEQEEWIIQKIIWALNEWIL